MYGLFASCAGAAAARAAKKETRIYCKFIASKWAINPFGEFKLM
jgi:hypothetical protein